MTVHESHDHDFATLRTWVAAGWPDHAEPGARITSEDMVTRIGSLVVKIHAAGSDAETLAQRLGLACQSALQDVLLAPLPVPISEVPPGISRSGPHILVLPNRRLLTAWPAGTPVNPDLPDEAPWRQAAALLARLHSVPPPRALPAMAGPARLARAVERLRTAASDHPATRDVFRAYATLPAWASGHGNDDLPATSSALVHGDWHLGQLVHFDGRWLLIDLDTVGIGNPAWDLARPAAWYAAGIIPEEVFSQVLRSYWEAGGTGVPIKDPWSVLEIPARALVIQSAATAIAKSATGQYQLDDVDEIIIECCQRIGSCVTT